MSALTFTLRQDAVQRIDVSCLVPEKLAGMSLDQIRALPMHQGNRKVSVGELFSVAGDISEELVFSGSSRLDHVGQGMSSGRIRVEGDAGAYAGTAMRGGEIVIGGSVGMFAACGMRGGTLTVGGNAGDFLGGALPGDMRGMRGGLVRVLGSAGDRAGDRMRRGAILIGGNAGECCASRMIAGTICVLGTVGDRAGYGMTRGTLLCATAPDRILPTFNECGTFELGFLTLLFKQWTTFGQPFAGLSGRVPRVQRYMGDLGAGGKGEILVLR